MVNYSDKIRPYCRKPGTRINAIMTLLEQGKSHEYIAHKYKTTEATIAVYEKALKGELSTFCPYDLDEKNDKIITGEKIARIITAYKAGVQQKDIARQNGLSRSQMDNILKRLRQEGRIELRNRPLLLDGLDDVTRLHDEGLKPTQIAERLGMEYTRVKRLLGKMWKIRRDEK